MRRSCSLPNGWRRVCAWLVGIALATLLAGAARGDSVVIGIIGDFGSAEDMTDLAITPPGADELDTLDLYHETSGGEAAVARVRREDASRARVAVAG